MALITVTSPSGAKFTVDSSAAEAFTGFLTDLEGSGYKIDPGQSGGYNPRMIAGTKEPSLHASGMALDINSQRNQRGAKTLSDLPPNVGELAAKHGLTWGGTWSGDTRDPMHFEYNPLRKPAMAQKKSTSTSTDDPLDKIVQDNESLTDTPPTTAAPATPSTAATSPDLIQQIVEQNEKLQADKLEQAAADAKKTPPKTTFTGLGKNIAAGVAEDAPATAINILKDPFANLIGRPLLSLGAAAHDAIARNFPSTGWKELSPEDRKALFEDFSNQTGNKVMDTAARVAGVPTANEITPATPLESGARNVAAATMLGGAVGGPVAAIASGGGAAAGKVAEEAVPEPYKDAASLVTNMAVGGGLTKVGRTPPVPASEAALIKLANDRYDVPLRVQPGNLAQISQDMPFSGAKANAANAVSKWRSSVSRELLGEDTDKLTPDVFTKVRGDVGKVMDRVEANPVHLDNTYLQKMADIDAEAKAEFGANSPEYRRIQSLIDQPMGSLTPSGDIPGGSMAALIHKGSRLDNAINTRNSDIGATAKKIRDTLQDTLERSVSPGDAADYKQARMRYANVEMLEPLTEKGKAGVIRGEIDPNDYLAAVRKSRPNAEYGTDPAVDLGRIGQMLPSVKGYKNPIAEAYTAWEMAKLAGAKTAGAAAGPGLVLNRYGAAPYLRSGFRTNMLINRPPPANALGVPLLTNPLLGSEN